ncbi:ArsR family transcriptional regulator [Conyzicola lurida]|uniref:ArsR family transcriptional regulator n=1 Tax=Conyzicola lurida TaxID=1172621 RepID=A0A841ANR9_9MICO|nr:metalloregulator ArsR/SmtB family transcription factor [Conyzicola lurida]MBB5843964.1 ArsR family transcriptional regulator [Conyzicola lurida]
MGIAGSTTELKLLGDPTRSRIMSLIMNSADGRQMVSLLARELNLRQPTVSHHLKALFDEGLLERHPEGRSVWYSVAPDQADRISELVQGTPDTEMTEEILGRISVDLATRFAGTFAAETVERYVRESYALLSQQSHAPRYLSSLTSQFAADRLSALIVEGPPRAGRRPEVLFVCVQNAGRSQMAAGILRHLAGDSVHVRTAGSAPAGAVRSVVVSALDEIGVPIGGEYPKPLTDEVVRAADIVITMGCGDACPVYPGRLYLDWDLEDPVGLPLARVRGIRDDIEARVRELIGTLEVNSR